MSELVLALITPDAQLFLLDLLAIYEAQKDN